MENNKEIDLVELFIKILLHVKKYKWILIVSIVIGFSIAYTISKFSTKLYKSHITVITNDNKGILISLLESLSKEKNISNISRSLNISNDISKQIDNIEIDNSDSEKEVNENHLLFNIYVTVKDTLVFEDVEKGLQFFAENNRYLKTLEQINRSQRNDLIRYINLEIGKLDSLRMEGRKKQIFYFEDNAAASKQIIDLYNKKQSLEKANKISKIFNIIKSFKKTNNPIKSFLKLVLIYVALIFFFGILLTIYLELRKLLKKKQLL